ncbi:signal transduction histidine kinase [Variovorax boronicumulans]|uniref:histidine kinase dimerization/phospho-acceptor domain-containing protein n=1 Tax=Variovorax boronicumulans TaxID=436515 RepID=UPI0024745B40|nr:histidine kinase dimerization/phospho-acceptor domain-containing protein [Variovorax boronicumulans]MDH6165492.1 signal transduction histidine kinase [Variovorax boronicumulans]
MAGVLAGIAGFAGVWVGAVLLRKETSVPAPGLSGEERHAELRTRMAHQARESRQLDHDLRAPVGAMAVALELLRTADDAELRREALDVLARQIARMNTLTQRLHDFSRGFND